MFQTLSHDEIRNALRDRSGSLDISISPVVSLKKRVPRFRRVSKFFAAMHFVRKFSSLGQNEPNNVDIVTPFAQILTKLNSIQRYLSQDSHESQNNLPVNKEETGSNPIAELELKTAAMNLEISKSGNAGENDTQSDKHKALSDIVWCLETLKKMQTHCSVSEMTINEFRKVLYEKQMSTESDSANEVFEFLKTYDHDNSETASICSISASNSRTPSLCSSDPDKRKISSVSNNLVEIIISPEEKDNADEKEVFDATRKDS